MKKKKRKQKNVHVLGHFVRSPGVAIEEKKYIEAWICYLKCYWIQFLPTTWLCFMAVIQVKQYDCDLTSVTYS